MFRLPFDICTSTSTASEEKTTVSLPNTPQNRSDQKARFACLGKYKPVITGVFENTLNPSSIVVEPTCWTRNTNDERKVTTLAGSFQAVLTASSPQELASETRYYVSVPCDSPVSENSIIAGFCFSGRSSTPITVQDNGRLLIVVSGAGISLNTQKPKKVVRNPLPSAEVTATASFTVIVQYNSV